MLQDAPMNAAMWAGLAGGIGLFLLGMSLMTDGLKLAAGQALRRVLERSTGTPFRALLSGALITAVVQSSSAVTVATIGFVNAALMSLSQAIFVTFGSNVGTTMTGWLVALVGFDVDVKAFALPAIGVGMLLRMLRRETPLGALGQALAGFGVFFLGIDLLSGGFEGLGDRLDFSAMVGIGPLDALLGVAAGFALTTIMQSSSAAMAVALTAASGGVLPLDTAATVVIGSNVGTTSTAALAAIGATPNAKRVAAAHVLFNGVTGLVALAVLPLMLRLLLALEGSGEPAAVLALFHTSFNLLGVVLLWGPSGMLVRFLNRRFVTAEEDEARPRFLDRNVVATPVLGLRAVGLELARVGQIAARMARAATLREGGSHRVLAADRRALDALVEATGEYVHLLRRTELPAELGERLPGALRVSRYFSEAAELAERAATLGGAAVPIDDRDLAGAIRNFEDSFRMLTREIDDTSAAPLEALEKSYQEIKARLLRAGTDGTVPVRRMVEELDRLSELRRLAEQIDKGRRGLAALRVADEAAAHGAAAESAQA
jgi:phosphate:Na+ symporter